MTTTSKKTARERRQAIEQTRPRPDVRPYISISIVDTSAVDVDMASLDFSMLGVGR